MSISKATLSRITLVIAAGGLVLLFTTPAAALRLIRNTVLSADVYGQVEIAADNVRLDCAGHTIHYSSDSVSNCPGENGNPSYSCAIKADGRRDITIANCNVSDPRFYYGIWVRQSTRPIITKSNTRNTVHGIHLQGTSFADISQCKVARHANGIELFGTERTNVTSSNATDCHTGFYDYSGTFAYYYKAIATRATWGFLTESSFQTTYDNCKSNQHSDIGFYLWFTQWPHLVQNVMNSNSMFGLQVANHSSGGLIEGNHALGQVCDADQIHNSENTWEGNFFGTTCGTVPEVH